MRPLITSDVFAAVRIIRASGMREELKQLIRRALESDTPAESVGIEGFLVIAEAMAEKKSEDAIYEFLAGPFEITPGEVAALPVDKLLESSEIVIDRPKGSAHPRYPDFIYPLDYGYLKDTGSMDGEGIDLWRGSEGNRIDAVMCIVDLVKRDSEIKLLIGCSEEEKETVYNFHNESENMKGILIRR